MGRTKGTIKTGGRQRGTPNKATSAISEILKQQNFNPISNIIRKYSALSVSDQLKVDLKLIEYLFPKPSCNVNTEHSDQNIQEFNELSDLEIELKNDETTTRLMVKKKGYAERILKLLETTRPDLLFKISEK